MEARRLLALTLALPIPIIIFWMFNPSILTDPLSVFDPKYEVDNGYISFDNIDRKSYRQGPKGSPAKKLYIGKFESLNKDKITISGNQLTVTKQDKVNLLIRDPRSMLTLHEISQSSPERINITEIKSGETILFDVLPEAVTLDGIRYPAGAVTAMYVYRQN